MIYYNISTKFSNKIAHHIVGNIYADTNGKLYLFLGRGFIISDSFYYRNKDFKYVYLRLKESACYIQPGYRLEDILEEMTKKEKDITDYISVLDKPKNFITDFGKLVDTDDSDYKNIYKKEFTTFDYVIPYKHFSILDLTENMGAINGIDMGNVCDIEKIINERKDVLAKKKKEKLRECPFCNSTKHTLIEFDKYKAEYAVGCEECNIFFKGKNKLELIDKWNTRKNK